MLNKNRLIGRMYKIGAILAAVLMLAACTPSSPVPPSQEPPSSQPASSEPPISSEPAPYGDPVTPGAEIAEKLNQTFKAGNPKGWLTVPGTTIDDAVLYNPENNDLVDARYNYDGKSDQAGILFADFRNTLADRTRLSRNTVIYGHNMEIWGSDNGKRFSQLLKYNDLDFAKEHQFITFSTKEDQMLWQVFAVFITDTDFYYIEPDPTDDGLMYIVSEASVRSEHHFDVDVTTSDKILTLSTCTYKYGITNKDQRFVVMAKLLPGTEGTPADVYTNETPKLPSFARK